MTKSRNEILAYITKFADQAHGKQVRKYTGDRYIVHPVRVMEMVSEYNDDVCVQAAALLHDVLEDTPVTKEEMHEALLAVFDPGMASRVLQFVVELTDVFIKTDYPRMKRRYRKEKEAARLGAVSAEAQTIKYADIIDNVTDIVKQDADFAKVFVREGNDMLIAMDAGNPKLRERALGVVDQCLKHMKKEAELS